MVVFAHAVLEAICAVAVAAVHAGVDGGVNECLALRGGALLFVGEDVGFARGCGGTRGGVRRG